MVQVVRADVDEYHDLFDANPFQHSMLQDAKAFGHRMLKGVGDSICSKKKLIQQEVVFQPSFQGRAVKL